MLARAVCLKAAGGQKIADATLTNVLKLTDDVAQSLFHAASFEQYVFGVAG
jgi:hypothetical protein